MSDAWVVLFAVLAVCVDVLAYLWALTMQTRKS